MRQPGAEMVAFMRHEDLGLVLQPAKGGGMDDAVAVALERRAGRAFHFVEQAATRAGGVAGIGRAGPVTETDIAKLAAHDPCRC